MEQRDHDALITLQKTVELKTSQICSSIIDLKADVKALNDRAWPCAIQREKCDEQFQKISDKIQSRPKKSQVFGFYAVVVSVLIAVFGFYAMKDMSHDESISNLNQKTVQIEKTIENYHQK
jgi:hypothetical protein